MVYGIALCPKSKVKILEDLGCADSKQLNEAKREEIMLKVCNNDEPRDTIGWAVESISPNFISNQMLGRVKVSLNEISMQSAEGLIRHMIKLGAYVTDVFVDTVGPPEKYQARLKANLPDLNFTVAKKADSTYPIVSAASIFAKVIRDASLKYWQFREPGIVVPENGFGSGYPNDPLTKTFLESVDPVFGYSRLVRFSWSTAQNLLEKHAATVQVEEVEEPEKKKSRKVTEFFSAKSKNLNRERPKIWKALKLDVTKSFF